MSHHFDSPTAIEDGRINVCDLFVFPSDPGTTALVLTVNPDAGLSSATSFRPDAVYEFSIATDGGTVPDVALRVRFGEPDADLVQEFTVLRAEGDDLREAAAGRELGRGWTEAVVPIEVGVEGHGHAWAGLAADPFVADGAALGSFLQAAGQGRYAPQSFDAGNNLFAGRDVTALALQVPDTVLGGRSASIWAQIILTGHAPQRRVSRMGQPMLRPLFFPVPGPEAEALNAGEPGTDRERHHAHLSSMASHVAGLAGTADAAAHGAAVADAFLPDVLPYRAAEPPGWLAGKGNGRSLDDDVFGSALFLLTGQHLGAQAQPAAEPRPFPHVSPPNRASLPPLAELFGLRAASPPDA